MDPLTMMAIGSALGLVKSQVLDKPKEDRERKLAAETQRYSPWTGLTANKINQADPFGNALKYGMTGASVGNSLANDEMAREAMLNGKINGELAKAKANSFTTTKDPWDFSSSMA